MRKTNADRLVDDYLRRLRAELRDLPSDRRREILSQFQEHIAEHRLELGGDREDDVRAMLDRLGDPVVLGAEARDRFGVRRRGRGLLEVTALVFMALAPVLLVAPAMAFGDGLVASAVLALGVALALLWPTVAGRARADRVTPMGVRDPREGFRASHSRRQPAQPSGSTPARTLHRLTDLSFRHRPPGTSANWRICRTHDQGVPVVVRTT